VSEEEIKAAIAITDAIANEAETLVAVAAAEAIFPLTESVVVKTTPTADPQKQKALVEISTPTFSHDEELPLTPGVAVELDIEVWPTSIVVPPGHRVGLTVRGKDYEYDGTDARVAHAPYPMKGVGPFTHTDPRDRPPEIFGGRNTLHFGNGKAPHLLLPVIPPK